MPRPNHLSTRASALTAAILIVYGTIAIPVAAQTSSSQPSANCSAYASVPLPAEAEKASIPKTSPSCASYRSYRGIGRSVNYAEARACAWQERLAQKANLSQNQQEPTAWVVGGSLILADIYFNGAGVKRNIPLAMRFACESEEGMAQLALPEITRLHGSLPAHGPFEFCDYAATTFSMDFCSGYASEIEDDRRSRYYKSLSSTMTPEQKAAFKKLLAAESAYVDAHALEVYQGGTIRAIRTIGSQDILNNLFHTDVVHYERRKWPLLSNHQIADADAILNREYKKQLVQTQGQTKEAIEDGVVTANHLASVQRTWEAYRDAWVAFARVRYPEAATRIRAEVTIDRYRLLNTISDF
ncbi:MAG: lysozyme inhibitor LprI family protein [Acidobacteriaceae bacterium]